MRERTGIPTEEALLPYPLRLRSPLAFFLGRGLHGQWHFAFLVIPGGRGCRLGPIQMSLAAFSLGPTFLLAFLGKKACGLLFFCSFRHIFGILSRGAAVIRIVMFERGREGGSGQNLGWRWIKSGLAGMRKGK
ncbi:hypothetical protein CEXT_138461 [Caerostris extrusa]|uniref:Uncharacterized protein n=1 Tax=Caerostris extrusa TaxID=172846 RepID=A0AAV4VNB8_CAEEX|nr:hypothetical protein CEXT_138461 [Caerostris extrusa]